MDRLRDDTLARRLNAIALVVSVAIILALPANHLFTAYDYESQRIRSEIQSIATDLSRLTFEKPEVWQFQEGRIQELVERAHSHGHDSDRHIRITDNSGNVIVELGNTLDFPTISGNSPIRDGAVTVGTISLSEAVTHIWTHAITSLFLGIALGLAVFLILRYLPMRALLKREQQLQETTLQLQQAQRMEAIGQLTGGIAHDFNNLLCVVIGNLELIQDSLERKSAGYKFAQSAIAAAQRGATLTQQLLSFARKQMLLPKTVQLNTLVSGITGLLHSTLGETIRIETELADDLWQTDIDPVQLEAAIVNLATNARHAMPDGGVIKIGTANVRLKETDLGRPDEVVPGPYIAMTFSDNGVGIPAKILPNVFEPFMTTREVGQGSGLGLSMVHGYIRQSRGHVTIESEEGVGTTLTLYFPAITDNPDAEGSSLIPMEIQGRHRETVLVVEDDPDLLKTTAARVSGLGYSVLQAADGEAALEVLKKEPSVKLLFTDVVLPNQMNGAELAGAARKIVPGIRVVYTSGYNENITGPDGVLGDGDTMLAKPYRQNELAQSLRKALDC